MHKLCEYISDELKELEKKVSNGQDLTKSEIELGDMLAHFEKCLLTSEAMKESGYSEARGMSRNGGRSSRDGASYDDYSRGRSERRDSRGRFSRGEDMSYGDAREELMMYLREYMKTASEDEKHDARRFMNALKNA